LGQDKAQTTAIPSGIARICNAAMAQKARFYVPDRMKHHTRHIGGSGLGHGVFVGMRQGDVPVAVSSA
jgi:hypothetical protein